MIQVSDERLQASGNVMLQIIAELSLKLANLAGDNADLKLEIKKHLADIDALKATPAADDRPISA